MKVKETQDGKGSRLEYTLMPVDYVLKRFKNQLAMTKTISLIDESEINQAESIYDTLGSLSRQLNDFVNDLRSLKPGEINPNVKKKVIENVEKFERKSSEFKSKLKQTYMSIRESRSDMTALSKFLNNLQVPLKIEEVVPNYENLRADFKLIKEIKRANFEFLSANLTNHHLVCHKNLLVVYASLRNDSEFPKYWHRLENYIEDRGDYFKKFKLFVYDYDIEINEAVAASSSVKEMQIKLYENCELVDENFRRHLTSK